jgi:hypothetical protein
MIETEAKVIMLDKIPIFLHEEAIKSIRTRILFIRHVLNNITNFFRSERNFYLTEVM